MKIGLTPIIHIMNAATTGIQALYRLSFALFAMRKTGMAIKATTAGRIP